MFRTVYTAGISSLQIDHQSTVVTLGSCFADVLGTHLEQNKFHVLSNPFGVLYNPLSIFYIMQNTIYDDAYFVERDGLWFHYAFHSEIYGMSKEELKSKINILSVQLEEYLKKCKVIVLTFGSAFGYRSNFLDVVVGNCHKMPSRLFKKEFSEPSVLTQSFEVMDAHLRKINPRLQYILTVSPVRHLKDTLVLNSASKSSLRLACHQLTSKYAHVHYFPAYEIMLDDLRDYRFFKEDMIHPTPVAETYIWEKFKEMYFSDKTKAIIDQWSSILKALRHKPFYPASPQHKKFLEETIEKIQELSKFIPVEEELQLLLQKL